MTRVHAFRDDALGDHDATGLTQALAAGEVSIPEVVDAAIARAEAVDGDLGALAYRTFDRARAEAKDPGPGFFAGVPTLIKDNVALAGVPTREGGDCLDPPPERRDGDLVRMMRATGLIPIGKSQLSEFGFSASAEHPRLGPVRNPWNPAHTAGASSSGSAAMVAAGVVPLAHANDGGGSIRIPAAVNGLVGLKPTRDRYAQDAIFRQMPLRIVQDGVVTRSVRDQAAYLRETEKVYRNVALPPIGDVTDPGRKRLRVAFVPDGVDGPTEESVRAEAVRVAGELERLGHRVEEVELPVDASFGEDFVQYWGSLALVMMRTSRLKHGRRWHPELTDNLTRGLAAHTARRLPRLPGAVRRLKRSSRRAAELYATYDVVLSPTLSHPTPRIGHLDPTQDFDTIIDRLRTWVAFTPWQNATGDPAMSLPLGVDRDGLPVGIMVGAGAGQERLLLGLGLELEEALGWARIDQHERV